MHKIEFSRFNFFSVAIPLKTSNSIRNVIKVSFFLLLALMFVGVDAITFRCCCNIKWDINSKLHIPSHLCDFTHHFFFSRYFVDLFIIIVSFVTRAPCYNLQWIYDESWCSVIWSMQPLIDFIEFLMASDFFFVQRFFFNFHIALIAQGTRTDSFRSNTSTFFYNFTITASRHTFFSLYFFHV